MAPRFVVAVEEGLAGGELARRLHDVRSRGGTALWVPSSAAWSSSLDGMARGREASPVVSSADGAGDERLVTRPWIEAHVLRREERGAIVWQRMDAPVAPAVALARWARVPAELGHDVWHFEPLGDVREAATRLFETQRVLRAHFGFDRVSVLPEGPGALPFRALLASANAYEPVTFEPRSGEGGSRVARSDATRSDGASSLVARRQEVRPGAASSPAASPGGTGSQHAGPFHAACFDDASRNPSSTGEPLARGFTQPSVGERTLRDAVRAEGARACATTALPRSHGEQVPLRLGIVGTNIGGSRSPSIHPAPFDRLDLPRDVDLGALLDALHPHYRGFAVTSPFKAVAASHVGARDGAINTLVRAERGGWAFANTDVAGARAVLAGLARSTIHVLGDGGAAVALRAAAAALGIELAVLRRRDVPSGALAGAFVWTWPAGVEPPAHLRFDDADVAIIDYGSRGRRVAAEVRARGGRPAPCGSRWFIAQARAQRALWARGAVHPGAIELGDAG